MKEALDPEMGIKLRQLLIGTGVTQGEIARRMGYTPAEVCRILSGHRSVPDGFTEDYRAAFVAASQELLKRSKQAMRELTRR